MTDNPSVLYIGVSKKIVKRSGFSATARSEPEFNGWMKLIESHVVEEIALQDVRFQKVFLNMLE